MYDFAKDFAFNTIKHKLTNKVLDKTPIGKYYFPLREIAYLGDQAYTAYKHYNKMNRRNNKRSIRPPPLKPAPWRNQPRKKKFTNEIGRSKISQRMAAAPVNYGTEVRNRGNKLEDMVIRHTELIEPAVMSNAAFTTSYVFINPGIASTFKWISQIAPLFEQYTVLGMRFRYVPACPTSTGGTVAIAFDYDVYDDTPESLIDMLNMTSSCSNAAWDHCSMGLSKEHLEKRRNLYVSADNPQGDTKTYHLGYLVWAVQGQANSTTVLGQIYCDYSIKLHMPQGTVSIPTSLSIATEPISATASAFLGDDPGPLESQKNWPGYWTFESSQDRWYSTRSGYYTIVVSAEGTGLGAITPIIGSTSGRFSNDFCTAQQSVVAGSQTETLTFSTAYITEGNYFRVSTTIATTITNSFAYITPSNKLSAF